MKRDKIIISAFVLCLLIVGLNTKFSSVPPLGKVLNPFSGFVQNDIDNPLSEDSEMDLNSEVSVFFDENNIPHIFANNENDLYYVQGYLHAKDRLWQMDFLSRVAAGRLSEVLGNVTLEADKEVRRKGLTLAAKKSLDYIIEKFPDTYKHFISYSKGVNTYINQLKAEDFPIEFKLLAYSPEEWSPLKVVLMQKYMADMLSGYDNDLGRSNTLNSIGVKKFEELYSNSIFFNMSPMIDTLDKMKFSKTDSIFSSVNFMDSISIEKEYYLKPDNYKSKSGNGSNTWVIGSGKSSTGYPILANDPHLNLTSPSIWYEMQLSKSNNNCYGVSIPGIPYIVIGFNDNIAWGITNGETDVKDWYALKIKNNNSEYLLNGKWLKTIKRVEEISVFGSVAIKDTVYSTILGPVFDNGFASNESDVKIVMSWVGNETSNDFNTFYLLNKATNYADYNSAIQYLDCPNLNISFASKSDIAISHQGKIPIRSENEGVFVSNGTSVNESSRFIPKNELPTQKNPTRDFIYSCNQIPVRKDYPYVLYGYYELNRNRRLDFELSKNKRFTLSDMMNLQLDNFDILASEALPLMLKNVNLDKLPKSSMTFIDSLKSWDYRNRKNSVIPTLYHNLWDEFCLETWDDFSNYKIKPKLPDQSVVLDLLKNDINSKYFDIDSTQQKESGKDLLNKIFKEYLDYFYQHKDSPDELWGNTKKTRFEHLMKIKAFSGTANTDGYYGTLNATARDHGPGWRMIVVFEKNGPEGYGINPCGQSGNPGSKYYNNGIEDWAMGKYYKFNFMKIAESQKFNKYILK